MHGTRGSKGTDHETRQVNTRPSPAQDHIARNFQEQVADEEDGKGERIVTGR
jgi:hypothetical protein